MLDLRDEKGNVWHTQEKRVKRLNTGVKCAHLVVPFQCETCWFRLLENREPQPEDKFYIACLRRANLDAIAGRSKDTIVGHANRAARIIRNCREINKTPSFPPRGPFPDHDCVGMGVAVEMVQESTIATGRITETIQFSSLRQIRSTYTVAWSSSFKGMIEGGSFAKGTGKVRLTKCPTESVWFSDFLRGCEFRMGYESMANKPITIQATIAVLDSLRRRAEAEEFISPSLSNHCYKVGAMLAIATAGSLRGNEAFFLSLAGVRDHLSKGRRGKIPENYSLVSEFSEEEAASLPHVTICLLGQFKAQSVTDYHMIVVASVSRSGLNARWWVEKLVEVCENEGRTEGPAFADADGRLGCMLDYDATFREAAKEVQSQTDLIGDDLDVSLYLSLSRTPRKTAETRAKQAGVSTSIQDAVNRWRSAENAQGRRPRFKATRDIYASAIAEVPNTWRYSYAL